MLSSLFSSIPAGGSAPIVMPFTPHIIAEASAVCDIFFHIAQELNFLQGTSEEQKMQKQKAIYPLAKRLQEDTGCQRNISILQGYFGDEFHANVIKIFDRYNTVIRQSSIGISYIYASLTKPEDTQNLISALSVNRSVTTLALYFEQGSNCSSSVLVDILASCPNLTALHFCNLQLSDIEIVVKALSSLHNLMAFTLGYDDYDLNISQEATARLVNALPDGLQALTLANQTCSHHALLNHRFPDLILLNLNRTRFNSGSMGNFQQELQAALSFCPKLVSLHLADIDIQLSEVKFLADMPSLFPHLVWLDLRSTKIDDNCIPVLVKALPRCSNLTVLDLAGAEIQSSIPLLKVLPDCRKLEFLFLHGRNITIDISVLAGILPKCSKLTALSFQGVYLDNEEGQALASALLLCLQLREIHLQYNDFTKVAVRALARTVLSRNYAILITGIPNFAHVLQYTKTKMEESRLKEIASNPAESVTPGAVVFGLAP